MRTQSTILGLAAALALSGAAIGSAQASPTFTSIGPASITVGDLTFSNISYSNSSDASSSKYSQFPATGGVTVTTTTTPYAGLVFTPSKSWAVTSKSRTLNVILKYHVSGTNNALIDDAFLHFAGATKTTTKHGPKKLGTINDYEKDTFTKANGHQQTVTIGPTKRSKAVAPSTNIDKTFSHDIAVKSLDVVQTLVLHASQSKNLWVTLAHFTDEFSTKDGTPKTDVPEPGSLALLGVGLAGLGLLSRRRKHA